MATSMREVVQSKMGKEIEATCLELALEGEKHCKSGDCQLGIQFLEAAVRLGTEDLKTLSAIYSQLGNAYFYLQNYAKALEYHRLDCNLAKRIGDRLGEAKACGNLGNTLKILGKFNEAIACCECHLRISREMNDQVSEARALYNLGNVCHARGKYAGRTGEQDPGELPPQVKEALSMAAKYYEENLIVVRELSDRIAEGRSCGNLGNTHYLLGNFHKAIKYHSQRLVIAKEFSDTASERRAYSNLGNCYIFLADFNTAAENYLCSLELSRKLGDRTIEAQACYSLGNTYTLLRDYLKAIEYHGLHLTIAREVNDRVGEGRACWSLGNAYTALGQHAKALRFADLHYIISEEVGDESSKNTARLNIIDLRRLIGISDFSDSSVIPADKSNVCDESIPIDDYSDVSSVSSTSRVRRQSMEQMELMNLTPRKEREGTVRIPHSLRLDSNGQNILPLPSSNMEKHTLPVNQFPKETPQFSFADDVSASVDEEEENENFFSLLEKYQSRRMDEQRYVFRATDETSPSSVLSEKQKSQPVVNTDGLDIPLSPGGEKFFRHLTGIQESCGDDPTNSGDDSSGAALPGLNSNPVVVSHLNETLPVEEKSMPDDAFFDMLMQCQSTRINDQRSSLPGPHSASRTRAPTVPEEDFFNLIQRFQSNRLEDQRCAAPEGLNTTGPACFRKKRAYK